MMNNETMIEIPQSVLLDYALELLKLEGEYDLRAPESVSHVDKWDELENIEFGSVTDHGQGVIEWTGQLVVDGSRRTARKTHWHPAEYEHFDVTLEAVLMLDVGERSVTLEVGNQ